MSEAPERIWARFRLSRVFAGREKVAGGAEYVRADKLEELKAENGRLTRLLEGIDEERRGALETIIDRNKALQDAERLAGARVVVKPLEWGDIDGDIVARTEIKTYRCSKFGDGWDLLIDGTHTKPYRHGVRETYSLEESKAAAQADFERRILSALADHPRDTNPVVSHETANLRGNALAEPAGEAEPRQFLASEDGEFNGNADEAPIAAEDGRAVDWVDVTGWGVFKGHAIPVEVARYIATKINLYDEHRTTPPASAIREAATHRYKKRGTEYVLIGIGKMQAEHWRDPNLDAEYDCQAVDMREVAIYRSVDDGSLWVRPREEFEDGRFAALAGSAE